MPAEKQNLKVSLERRTAGSILPAYKTIRTSFGNDFIDIQLRRCLRIPASVAKADRKIPGSFSAFPLFNVDEYAEEFQLPDCITSKSGVLVPVYRT